MEQWYCIIDGKTSGPMTTEELRSLARQGRLRPTDLVWREGLPEWTPAQSVEGLLEEGTVQLPLQPLAGAPAGAAGVQVPPRLPARAGAPRAAGLALAALILGLCGIIPSIGILCGLAGLILGIVALAKGTSRRGTAIAGVVTGVAMPALQITLIFAVLFPALVHMRELARRAVCANNLNQMGKAIALYVNENDGVYPPDLDKLLASGCLVEESLDCPSAESPGGCDYFYLPLRLDVPADAIMACRLQGQPRRRGTRRAFRRL